MTPGVSDRELLSVLEIEVGRDPVEDARVVVEDELVQVEVCQDVGNLVIAHEGCLRVGEGHEARGRVSVVVLEAGVGQG